ncbi:HlyD family efflux transporter periplasmic adaptor subunit [Zavarzinella formosa]|uniref:HlyD family efflux transporter periplasmic adaptor subunit n=1 Tax=Zavarzinella formosa TaxID=360055 RepID=UPI000307FA93|nr:HlyD family efflux transporter periplasmic adaptor subunit [Zavarzinella formosa]
MSRRKLFVALAPLILGISACSDAKNTGAKKLLPAETEAVVEIGQPLYTGDFRPAKLPGADKEPLEVPAAHVVILHKLDLPSRVDGTINWIGIEITEDEALKLKPQDVYRHGRDKKFYRRLSPGDQVKRNQVVALMDDEQAFIEFFGASKKSQAATEEADAYEKTVKKLAQIVYLTEDGARKGIVPQQEFLNSQATQIRYEADLTNRLGAKQIALADLDKAKYMLEKHTLRSAIDGEVQQVLRHEGEGIKATEPMLTVYNFDRLRIEGNLPKEYIDTVRPGDEVSIEGPRDIPSYTTFEQHTTNKPITVVVVGQREGKPVVVSAGEDGWVYAWTRDLTVIGSWKQPNAVRALAVTPASVESPILLVGNDNGKTQLYNLATGAKEPLRELSEVHDGAVNAAAFSPDGKYCVTADERSIHLWETATGKRIYKFPAGEHHSPITSLTFTPQGRVVSAGKEPSVRVWQVGEKSAKVLHRFDSRTGDVAMPGVSDDGSRLLLDADKARLDVIHLQDGRKERPLISVGEAARFQTFAVWSPEINKKEDNRLIATGGATEGVVQLWRAPSPTERGTEFGRLICKNYSPASCAAFTPNADQGFIVVGTKKGDINVWNIPTDAELKTDLSAKVTHIEKAIDSSGRTARVFVDFDNPKKDGKYPLRPGSTVTLIIRSKP